MTQYMELTSSTFRTQSSLMDYDDDEKYTQEIYKALMREDRDEVIKLCNEVSMGGLHYLSDDKSTVLHMAAYGKDTQLMVVLLNQLPEDYYELLTRKRNRGNTILHEVAKFSRHIPAAEVMLSKAPILLTTVNERGETPLFNAARYGKSKMFWFLDQKINETTCGNTDQMRKFHVRDDNNTILHAAILTNHFELALHIAERYSDLIPEQTRDGMTALQLLASNPKTFCNGNSSNLFKRLIYPCVSVTHAISHVSDITQKDSFWDEIRKKKKRRESASKLATLLIEKDMTWKCLSESKRFKKASQDHNIGDGAKSLIDNGNINNSIPQIPLFLATESGCSEIVEGILVKHPQAVNYVDSHGRNILHVAIKHRQHCVLDILKKMKMPMKKLRENYDNEGNSILHMVGAKTDELIQVDKRVPAMILQEDLLLFKRVKKISATHVTKHLNHKGMTAKKLLTECNAQLHSDAKEWMKRTAENCSIVAVLIATVAFAAAYTVPGGTNDKGYPILQNNRFFALFTIADVLSLGFALTAVIIFLSILSSSFRLKDFRRILPEKLMLGFIMLILSMCMMILAFSATVILLIHNKEKGISISLYSVAFFPVTVFAISYFRHLSFMQTLKNSFAMIWKFIPRLRNRKKFAKSHASQTCISLFQVRCPV